MIKFVIKCVFHRADLLNTFLEPQKAWGKKKGTLSFPGGSVWEQVSRHSWKLRSSENVAYPKPVDLFIPPTIKERQKSLLYSLCFQGMLSSVVRRNNTTSTCEEASSLQITRGLERPAVLYETSLIWKRETWLKAPFPQEKSGWWTDQAYGARQRNMCRCSYWGITGEGRPQNGGCCLMGGESCAY